MIFHDARECIIDQYMHLFKTIASKNNVIDSKFFTKYDAEYSSKFEKYAMLC